MYFDNIEINEEFDYFHNYHLTDKKVVFLDIKNSSFNKDIHFYNVFRKDFEHLDGNYGYFKLIDCSFLGQEINLNNEEINIEELIIAQAKKGLEYGCYIEILNIENVRFEITKEEFTILRKIPTMDIEIRPTIL